MNGGRLGEPVRERNSQALALPEPDLRAGYGAVIGPDLGRGVALARQRRLGGAGNKAVLADVGRSDGTGGQGRGRSGSCARRQQVTA